jgi:phage shock protein A
MFFTWLITGLTALSLLLGIANTVWAWMSKGGAAQAARLDRLEDGQDAHDRRIQRVEDKIEHLPTRETVHELDKKLTEVIARFSGIERDMGVLERAVERIERHLMGEKA